MRRAVEETRYRIAFYGSTRTYSGVLSLHGWDEQAAKLHELSKRGRWDEMAKVVTDEMVETFAAVAPYDGLVGALRKRFGGLSDRVFLSFPRATPDGLVRELLSDIRRHPGALRRLELMPGDITIGLLGLGTVGTGVVKLIERNQAMIRKRLGCGLRIAAAAVRNPRRKRDVSLGRGRIISDARRLIADPSIDIVVELIGGVEPAKSLVLGAIAAGKDVVTANKALLATHGQEVFEAAERASVRLGFEASVAGGVPIIRVLRQALAGDRNRAIYGIVNGTCNSILTAMTDRGTEFQEALAEAQAAGLAEADPSLDVDGTDAAQKLSLLVALAFGARCPVDAIHTEGIRRLGQLDVAFAGELGYVIKLLAIAKDDGRAIEARVHPTMIPKGSLLSDVRGAFNAVHVQGEALGPTLYVGEGAGMLPTATAVLGDIVDVAHARIRGGADASAPLGMPWKKLRRARDPADRRARMRVLPAVPGVRPPRCARPHRRHPRPPPDLDRFGDPEGSQARHLGADRHSHARGARAQSAGARSTRFGRLPVVSGKPVFVRIEDRL